MSTSSRKPTPFIGVGTGRCGTTSLAEIIDACENVRCTHEAYSFAWYEIDEEVGSLIRDLRRASEADLMLGDVGQSLISHLPELRSSIHALKVICIHRDKQGTVDSFTRYGWQKLRPGDKRRWIDKCYHSDGDYRVRSSRAFPVIDGITADQACGFYWEMYESMMRRIRQPVLHIQMEELNDDARLNAVFEFLEIPERDRVFIEKRKFWTIEEVEAKKRKIASGAA
jgi:hypothetical protein